MKGLLTATTIISLTVSCAKKQPRPSYTWLGIEKLNGNIKQVRDSKFNILNDTYLTNFDVQGNITSAKDVFDGQSREFQFQTIFDTNGKKIKVIATHKSWGHSNDSTIEEFDKNGLRSHRYDNCKHSLSSELYRYTKDGFVLQVDNYAGQNLLWVNNFIYNKKNWIIEDISTANFGNHAIHHSHRQYFDWDSHNNWLKMVNGVDTVIRKITYY